MAWERWSEKWTTARDLKGDSKTDGAGAGARLVLVVLVLVFRAVLNGLTDWRGEMEKTACTYGVLMLAMLTRGFTGTL